MFSDKNILCSYSTFLYYNPAQDICFLLSFYFKIKIFQTSY